MALKGIRVLEFAGLAPAPFCGMLLADLGAAVTRIDYPGSPTFAVCRSKRGKRAVSINLKSDEGRQIVQKLVKTQDVVIDPCRPGVLERLQLSPDTLLSVNNKLIVARLTGFGQTGTLCDQPGHDINFLALSGVLSQLHSNQNSNKSTPAPPLNLLGDFAGGGLLCAFAILAALLERANSNKGQILDLSISEGVSYLCSWLWRSRDLPVYEHSTDSQPTCWFDGATKPFYRTYKCSDGRYIAVGCVERKFFHNLLTHLKLDAEPHTTDALLTAQLQSVFATKPLKQWMTELKDCDTCVSPLEDLDTAPFHPHNDVRAAYMSGPFGPEPVPSPRFSRVGHDVNVKEPSSAGQHTVEVLRELDIAQSEIDKYIADGVVGV